MIYTVLQYGYYAVLGVLTLCILAKEGLPSPAKGIPPMIRTVATFCLVSLASMLLSGLWPSVPYSWAMVVVDALACVAITMHPAGRWQAIIGLSYLFQIAIHVGRILNGPSADIFSVWLGLSVTAILQLLLLGGWCLHDGIRSISSRRRINAVSHGTHIEGVG